MRAERLADYIKRTVDAAPPLSVEQRDRLALLLRGGGAEPPGGPGRAAPGTQQHPAERRHRQRGSGPATPEAPPLSAEVSALGGASA